MAENMTIEMPADTLDRLVAIEEYVESLEGWKGLVDHNVTAGAATLETQAAAIDHLQTGLKAAVELLLSQSEALDTLAKILGGNQSALAHKSSLVGFN